MRELYLKSVLRQDVGYFDTTATSGRLLQGINEDCITLQEAMGNKVWPPSVAGCAGAAGCLPALAAWLPARPACPATGDGSGAAAGGLGDKVG